MSGPDEFDEFLARRKPVFRRPEEDPLEPPAELDRVVLRRAREAIEADRPEPLYQGPRWGMPVALAATLLVALTVILHVGMQKKERIPEVTVQNATQQVEPSPQTPVASAAPAASRSGVPAAAPPPAPLTAASSGPREAEPAVVASASSTPAWRSDQSAWIAEIQRLREAGKTREADAEQAEFNREHRAYAGAPDR